MSPVRQAPMIPSTLCGPAAMAMTASRSPQRLDRRRDGAVRGRILHHLAIDVEEVAHHVADHTLASEATALAGAKPIHHRRVAGLGVRRAADADQRNTEAIPVFGRHPDGAVAHERVAHRYRVEAARCVEQLVAAAEPLRGPTRELIDVQVGRRRIPATDDRHNGEVRTPAGRQRIHQSRYGESTGQPQDPGLGQLIGQPRGGGYGAQPRGAERIVAAAGREVRIRDAEGRREGCGIAGEGLRRRLHRDLDDARLARAGQHAGHLRDAETGQLRDGRLALIAEVVQLRHEAHHLLIVPRRERHGGGRSAPSSLGRLGTRIGRCVSCFGHGLP